MRKETIAAISTGMTNSGIGIVRISGEEAVLVADRIYRGKKKLCEVKSHTINYGYIVDREISSAEKKSEEVIDEVLVTVMKAPGTFTGEDTVEIDCHGGVYVMRNICCKKSVGTRVKKRGKSCRTGRIYKEGIFKRKDGSFTG